MTAVPPCGRGGFSGRGLGVTECPAMSYFTNFARLWTSWAARLGQQTRRDELHGLLIFVCRDDDGKWLVRAIFMARTFE